MRMLAVLAAAAVAIGGITYDHYLVYLKRTEWDKPARIYEVRTGQAVTVGHVTWTASFESVPSLPGGQTSERGSVWMRIDLRRTAADERGTAKTGDPSELLLEDRGGRRWATVLDDGETRPERLAVGTESRLTAYARIPEAQTDEVHLLLRPSNYRADIPTDKLFTADLEPNDDVIRVRR
ncbi:hypothetical protein [Nonomuraea longicatena]|uniref:hypothetical protein n=1 Tax=Nonomuraea longicatena TaxID=83682 RepID=UPI0031CF572F